MKKKIVPKRYNQKKAVQKGENYGDAQIEALKSLVLRKHTEWRKPKHDGFLKFYLLLGILIFIGIYMMVSDNFKMSALSTELAYIFTMLLIIAAMVAIFHHYKINCRENIEEKVENEILKFLHEKKEQSRL